MASNGNPLNTSKQQPSIVESNAEPTQVIDVSKPINSPVKTIQPATRDAKQ